MRKTISVICVFVFILFILLFPEVTVHAAADGLLLWYTSLLPSTVRAEGSKPGSPVSQTGRPSGPGKNLCTVDHGMIVFRIFA